MLKYEDVRIKDNCVFKDCLKVYNKQKSLNCHVIQKKHQLYNIQSEKPAEIAAKDSLLSL